MEDHHIQILNIALFIYVIHCSADLSRYSSFLNCIQLTYCGPKKLTTSVVGGHKTLNEIYSTQNILLNTIIGCLILKTKYTQLYD